LEYVLAAQELQDYRDEDTQEAAGDVEDCHPGSSLPHGEAQSIIENMSDNINMVAQGTRVDEHREQIHNPSAVLVVGIADDDSLLLRVIPG